MTPTEPDTLELFKIAVETRQRELQFFWQRSNYFLVLDTAIGAGFLTIRGSGYAPLIALFGIVVSFIWFKMILGSKFWQVRWEAAVERLEKQYAPSAKLFRTKPKYITAEVERLLKRWPRSCIQTLLDPLVLAKPSPSTWMACLSLLFLAVWAVLFLVTLPAGFSTLQRLICPHS